MDLYTVPAATCAMNEKRLGLMGSAPRTNQAEEGDRELRRAEN